MACLKSLPELIITFYLQKPEDSPVGGARKHVILWKRRGKTLSETGFLRGLTKGVLTALPKLTMARIAGPTVVVDQQHCSAAHQEDTPRRSLLVYPRKNNFLLFDSRLGHGVLDTLSEDLRMTLLINWWHHKPLVSRLGPAAEQLLIP